MAELSHSIRVAAKRTGLSPHVIRIWERRYRAVEPARTGTNRRLYSQGEIERLDLLRQATAAGHTISHIAHLPAVELQALIRQAAAPMSPAQPRATEGAAPADPLLADALEAVRRLDTHRLEAALRAGSLQLGSQGLLLKVAAPLARAIGDLWQTGEITAAHEHFASAVIRVFLGALARPFPLSDGAPNLVVATPTGQLHELGAVLVATAAASHGWRVTYLGVSLPATEIAGVAIRNQAKAVALSLVYPADDPFLPGELENLRRLLPLEISILTGGRAAAAYGAVLEKIGTKPAGSLESLYATLDALREAT